MKSIISDAKKCYICGSVHDLEKHHCVFGTASRKKADRDGLWVYLCHLRQEIAADKSAAVLARKVWG